MLQKMIWYQFGWAIWDKRFTRMLLSPHARRVCDKFDVCPSCKWSMNMNKTRRINALKYSLANNFVIGHMPNHIKFAFHPNVFQRLSDQNTLMEWLKSPNQWVWWYFMYNFQKSCQYQYMCLDLQGLWKASLWKWFYFYI